MIDRLLETARRKVDGADALWRREEQTAVAFESGRLKAAGISEEAGLNLRVLSQGRMGGAGTTAAKPAPEALLQRAAASDALGEAVGLAAVVQPLEQALSGKSVLQGSSPLADKVGAVMFDERLSIIDDPLTPGRPASRPVDDECVPSRATGLVERGAVGRFVYDLETAARAKTQSTGNGRRGIFGKPHIGYTNVLFRIGDGVHGGAQHAAPPSMLGGGLIADIADGLIVDDLIGVGQGNVISGAFSHPVGLAYRVQRGEVTGRVKDAAVAGNAYDLLKRIGGVGTDGRWLGSRWSPSLLLDGVSVARR